MQPTSKKQKIIFFSYLFVFLGLLFYSFTQIDLGLVISRYSFIYKIEKAFQYIGYFNRPLSTVIYLLLLLGLTSLYIFCLRLAEEKKLDKRFLWKIIISGVIVLFLSYNAFSYDLFNYLFDAKIITYYHANPYIHKALDYPGDPTLAFMHWTHRAYPYGPVWLVLTVPLSFVGLQLFLPTLYLFKLLMVASYLGSLFYIGKIFQRIKPEKELFGLVFFGLNPLVLIESLVSAHLDIVMMFFSLLAFYFLLEKNHIRSYLFIMLSIGVKFLTVLLLPVALSISFLQFQKKRMNWDVLFGCSLVLLIIGVLIETYQSGNFQPWYLLAPLSFAVFLSQKYYILIPSVTISVVSLLLYAPYLYLGNWNPPVPQILSATLWVSYIISFIFVTLYFRYKRSVFHHHK